MTITVNGKPIPQQSGAPALCCDSCGKRNAILHIDAGGLCRWLCPSCPSSSTAKVG